MAGRILEILRAGLRRVNPSIKENVKHDRWKRSFIPLEFMYQKVGLVPRAVDWKKQGRIGRVQLQYAGNCFAYATRTVVTAELKRNGLYKGPLDVVELTECDPQNSNKGGQIEKSLFYIYKNGLGLESHRFRDGPRFYIHSYETLYSEVEFEVAVSYQPIAAGIGASPPSFRMYTGNTVYEGEREYGDLNHAVALTGYGECADGKHFWHLKNSHGEDWGDKGFMRLRKNINANGLGYHGVYPIILSSGVNLENLNDPETLRTLFGFNVLYSCRVTKPSGEQFIDGIQSRYSLDCLATKDNRNLIDLLKLTLNQNEGEMHNSREQDLIQQFSSLTCEIDTLPKYLLVWITRDYDNMHEIDPKTHWKVNVPEMLNLKEFCTKSRIGKCSNGEEYELVAALNYERDHQANYLAYVKESDRLWIEFDFERNLAIRKIEVKTYDLVPVEVKSSYILLFKGMK